MTKLEDLKIKIFADGADLKSIESFNNNKTLSLISSQGKYEI